MLRSKSLNGKKKIGAECGLRKVSVLLPTLT